MNLKKTKYIIGGVFILVGIGIVGATLLPKSMQYYVTVDELMAHRGKYEGKELKVAGKVQAGSVQKSAQELLIQFQVENAGQVVHVSYRGAVPDTFKEGADVVVTGTMTGGNDIVATNVLAKCASRYEEKLTPKYQMPSQATN